MGFKDLLRGSITSSISKTFKDLFDRADQSGLGGAWTSVRSGFNISGNKAVGTTSSYPISKVTAPAQNADIKLSGISQGAAAALWITDSGNWFAVGIAQDPVNCNCVNQTVNVTGNTDYAWKNVPGNTGYAWTPVAGNTGYQYYWNAGNTSYGYYWNAGNQGYTKTAVAAGTSCTANNTSSCKTSSTTCNANNATGCNAYATTYCAYSYYSNANKKTVCGVYGGGACRTWGGGNCKTWGNVCNANNTTSCKTWTTNYTYTTNYFDNSYNVQYSWTNNNPVQYYYDNSYVSQYYYDNSYVAQYSWNNSYSYTQLVCQTCYPQYIRVIQSAASTISTLTSWTISALAKSLKIKTSGNQITISAFSDDNGVTQIDSDMVYTATGATVNLSYGISIIPSSYNQGYSIDSIEISKN